MKVGSLFSGIGGLDLGLERAGMRVIWQSEVDPYASRVLAKHWPDVPNLGDITKVDWDHVEPPDLICGGYPCQPFSLAGVRRGESDLRHLWPFFGDAVRRLRPRFALLENVPGHLSLGFGRVLGDLAELGYDTEWDCIPAAAVGAPHLRYRVFVVAYADGAGRLTTRSGFPAERPADAASERRQVPDGVGDVVRNEPVPVCRGNVAVGVGHDGEERDVADTDCRRLDTRRPSHSGRQLAAGGWWSVEPDVGRVAHGVPARVDRLRMPRKRRRPPGSGVDRPPTHRGVVMARSEWSRLHGLLHTDGERSSATRLKVCRVCSMLIHRGDAVAWLHGGWVHADCYPPDPADVASSVRRHPSNG